MSLILQHETERGTVPCVTYECEYNYDKTELRCIGRTWWDEAAVEWCERYTPKQS